MKIIQKTNIILFLLISFLLIGCSSSNNIKTQPIDYNKLQESNVGNINSQTYTFNEPELISEEDYVAYKFEKEKIADDLYLQRYIELKETGEGLIKLEFSGDGQGEHIEVIPKSFAESAEDIEFSIEPDEILNDDPVVKWNLNKANEKIKYITAKIKVAAYKKGEQVGQIEGALTYAKLLAGGDFDFSDFANLEKKAKKAGETAGKKAGLEEAQNQIIEHLDDFLFAADIQVCADKKDADNRLICILTLISKKPDWFDCEEIFSNYENKDMGHAITSCKAIQEDNLEICEKAAYNDVEIDEGTWTDYKTACENQFFIVKLNQCNGKFKDDFERCILENINDTGYKKPCDNLIGNSAEKCKLIADGKNPEDTDIKTTENNNQKEIETQNTNSEEINTQDIDMSEEEFCDMMLKKCIDVKVGKTEQISSNGINCMCFGSTDVIDCSNGFCASDDKDCDRRQTLNDQNSCFLKQAREEGKVSLCDAIIDADLETQNRKIYECYRLVALDNENCELCQLIPKEETRYRSCNWDCALKVENILYCKNIIEESSLESCIIQVAEKKKDISICEKERLSDYNKDNCYKKVAVMLKDKSICENINYQNIKDICLKNSE